MNSVFPRRVLDCQAHRIRAKQVLLALGLVMILVPVAAAAQGPWFPVLDNQAAWEFLPKTKSGSRDESLPVWARILARSLPLTTASLLDLDRVQRSENPLEPRLRAKIRWVAARANGSRYAEAYAQADLVRAGGDPRDLELINEVSRTLSEKERRTYQFARQLCEAAYEVTDKEVEALLADWGPADLTAIVLTVAYANFQDRLLQSLGVESEIGVPLPPSAIQFDWDDLKKNPLKVTSREMPAIPPDANQVPKQVEDAEWKAGPLAELQSRLKKQQLRAPRIPLPPDDVVERQTSPGMYPPGKAATIKWNGVGYGYQPKLTHAWFSTMRRFRDESALQGDFRQSVFWVVTRSNWCFY